ncbi:hypothetical protein OP10G_2111 [Fimbriimonas ginsengisoli Gsoil 348]|uniref:Uncharacterized protein n=1 Tax=Fimbriimonas ginsengisoli Gsoil 348 TaxID=661478 RepID=A0A068NV73_FIMGI|nr:hypothetical protein OP10G_2111 [Fimbriimonas ginsengisoli Gsoil 348]
MARRGDVRYSLLRTAPRAALYDGNKDRAGCSGSEREG